MKKHRKSEADNFVPVIIDIEASGFGKNSYPIEIGVIFSEGEKLCRLVRPEENWTYWDSEAEAVHKISRQILESHGLSALEIATELNQRLNGKEVYSDCWTVDKPWLDILFDAAKMNPTFKVRAIEMILDEPQWEYWNQAYSAALAKADTNRHRASIDAELIQKTWLETRTGQKYESGEQTETLTG